MVGSACGVQVMFCWPGAFSWGASKSYPPTLRERSDVGGHRAVGSHGAREVQTITLEVGVPAQILPGEPGAIGAFQGNVHVR